jgi:hypothetical protein
MQDHLYAFFVATYLLIFLIFILGGIAFWASPPQDAKRLHFTFRGPIIPMALGLTIGTLSASPWMQIVGWSICGLGLLAMLWMVGSAVAKRGRRTSR